MQPQRHTATSLAALAVGLLSCQIVQPQAVLPPVSAPPPQLVEVTQIGVPVRESAPMGLAEMAPAPLVHHSLDVLEARLLARARSLTPAEVAGVAVAIRDSAERFDLATGLVLAVIEVESTFDAFAVSPAGAMGLMQILPSTGEALARRHGEPWYGAQTLFDPIVNVRLGIAYLSELRHRFGHWPTALAAYNWGPSAIGRRVNQGAPIPAGYAKRVLSTQARRAKSGARTS